MNILLNILRPPSKAYADLVAECYCGSIFEYSYPQIFAVYATSQSVYGQSAQGQLCVSCPGCSQQVKVGSYELQSTRHIREKLAAKPAEPEFKKVTQ